MDMFSRFSSKFGVDIGDFDQYKNFLQGGRRCLQDRGHKPRHVRKNPFASLEYQHYDEIKAKCQDEGILFEDPEFEAVDESVFYSQSPREFEWLRPSVSIFVKNEQQQQQQ
ncbi:hypothetical protein ACOMHN_019714 [Nucella lapillus]